MPTRDEILEAFADWATTAEAAERLGCTKPQCNSARVVLAQEGYLETRFVDGIGNQYRATKRPYAHARSWHGSRPVQDAVLKELESGPKTPTQLAGATGCHYPSVSYALGALERRGLAERIGPNLWRLVRWPRGRKC